MTTEILEMAKKLENNIDVFKQVIKLVDQFRDDDHNFFVVIGGFSFMCPPNSRELIRTEFEDYLREAEEKFKSL